MKTISRLLVIAMVVAVLILPIQAWLTDIVLHNQEAELERFSQGLPPEITLVEVERRLRSDFDGEMYVHDFPPTPGPRAGSAFLLFQYSEPLGYWLGLMSSDVILVCAFDENEKLIATEVHIRTSSF